MILEEQALFAKASVSKDGISIVLSVNKMASIRKIITSPHIKSHQLPLSQAVQIDKTLYISGHLGMNKEGVLANGIKDQTRLALENIGHVLKAAGATYKNVVKCTVLLQDIKDFADLNAVYGEFFTERFPARMGYQVANLPIAGALVEIEAIAVVGEIKEA